jgi:hypothetical protein
MNLLFYVFILIFSFKKWNNSVAENGYDRLTKITLALLITQVVLASIYFIIVMFYNELVGSSLVNIIQTAFITTSMIPLIIDWNAKRKLNGFTGQSSIFILISMVLVIVIMAYTIVVPK